MRSKCDQNYPTVHFKKIKDKKRKKKWKWYKTTHTHTVNENGVIPLQNTLCNFDWQKGLQPPWYTLSNHKAKVAKSYCNSHNSFTCCISKNGCCRGSPSLNEFSRVVLSCFMLSRQTSCWTEVKLIQSETLTPTIVWSDCFFKVMGLDTCPYFVKSKWSKTTLKYAVKKKAV